MMKDDIFNDFKQRFGAEPLLFSAPGRINVIGEHTDYNDGFVLPAAIDKRIYFAIKPNTSGECRMHAFNLNESGHFPVSQSKPAEKSWLNYFIGVIQEIKNIRTFEPTGFDCVFGGNLPVGAGLSSSAALETGFAHAMNTLFDIALSPEEIMRLSQAAEHNFIGVKCGIMDQFAAVNGKKEQVMQLDCRTLESKYYPVHFSDYEWVLVNSNVEHSLAGSEYNVRTEQCAQGVGVVQKNNPQVRNLRDVTFQMLEDHADQMDETVYKRCRYVLEENQRVHQTCEALSNNDLQAIGKYLYAGHQGLSTMYEVSCPETDYLVDLTREMEAVLGARMMGGGFGGCTINLVRKDFKKNFEEQIAKAYQDKFNIKPEFYEVQTDDGIKSH